MNSSLSRRNFFKVTGTGLAGLWLPFLLSCSKDGTAAKPNVVFIMADDLGYHDLGCYGQPSIRTPNIDRLAAEGMRFTQCYTGGSVCAPSRSVLMTGQHLGHTTIRGNFGRVGGKLVLDNGSPQRRVSLKQSDVTVAEVMKKVGYATGITGKWGVGEPQTPGIPNKQGFDEWFGYLNQRRAHSYYPMYLWRNEEKVFLNGNRGGKEGQYTHDLITDFALEFVRKRANESFFLYLPYTVPHQEYVIPDIAPYENEDWPHDAKVYAAMVTRMDRDIGRLMDLLNQQNIDRQTMVFFCSDNGAANRWDGIFNSASPFRGHKGELYEGGIRTPMIVRQPGRVPAGTTSDFPWYFADVLPTLTELAGGDLPPNIDGISVVPTLYGQQQDPEGRYLYWESYRDDGFQQAIRWNQWKGVRLNADQPIELYNVENDVGETHNVAQQHKDVVSQIDEFMTEAHTDSPNWPLR